MKYTEYRNNIRTGDILAWSNRARGSIGSNIVRLFTESEYSHVGMAYIYKGRVFVLEAIYPCIRIVPLGNLLPCYVIHMEKNLSLDAEDFAFSLIGTGRYSFLEAAKSYFGLNNSESGWQCVEYVKCILKHNNFEITCRDVPSDLILELQKLGKTVAYLD